jgi:ABC-type lipoprotein release transport system permease subunit
MAEFVPKRVDALISSRMNLGAVGFAVRAVRADGLGASRGATDFGEYFLYFSFFLVVAALLLSGLFFKLSVEQRAHEVGLLRAVGFNTGAVRRVFLSEGLFLSAIGAVLGMIGGVAYGRLMMLGLRTWWAGAVGTTALALHISPASLIIGAVGGVAAAMLCIWATLRGLSAVSERSLLADQISSETLGAPSTARNLSMPAVILLILGAALIAAGYNGVIAQAGAFFGAGTALLAATLLFFLHRLAQPARTALQGSGWGPVLRIGFRNASYRPGRSVLSMAMVAAAVFILIAVDSFRKDVEGASGDRRSGSGGYTLQAELVLPLVHDPAGTEGREAFGLNNLDPDATSISIEPFRVRPGDDASCLNLYAPTNPRIMAPRDSFLREGRFSFRSSIAATEAEHANPWLLLQRTESDGAVPVIADANSMTYVLHRKLGEDIVIPSGGRDVKLRLVAALDDSIFQSELLMSEANFRGLFPEQEGYRFLLMETAAGSETKLAAAMERSLADVGADVRSTAQRLAEFHQVENTYLSTFQMLGGLGLLLGTIGLGAVLLRNVLERRRELALLRALGYRRAHFLAMTVAENALLLGGGLLAGAVCALLAMAPALMEQSGRGPGSALLVLIGSVLAAGLITSLVATALALRSSLLPVLRSE